MTDSNAAETKRRYLLARQVFTDRVTQALGDGALDSSDLEDLRSWLLGVECVCTARLEALNRRRRDE